MFWLMAASALVLNTTSLEAGNLPTGGTITAGQGNISQSGSTMTVQQNTAKMAANWDSFSIGANHTVNFVQPNAQSVALNRVVGSDPSVIQGHLNANGQVFLINPNGVLFTKTSQVNVGGIIASTLALSDADFVAGNYKFEGNSSNGIINQGNIVAGKDGNGGDVVLIAAKISNEGTINAQGGTVALGAGSKVTLDLGGVVKLHVDVGILDALIQNGGAIRSSGGTILLTANAAGALSRTVIKNTGVIEAQTLSTGANGKIILQGGTSDSIEVGGTLDASAPRGGDGGFIETSAGTVNLSDNLKVTTASSNGLFGHWFIDPEIIEIVPGSVGTATGLPASGVSQIGAVTLSNALALSNVDLNATGWIDFQTSFNYAGATDTVLGLYAPVIKLGGNISTSTAMLGLNFGGTYSSTFYNSNLMVYGASRTITTKGGAVNFYGNIGGGTTNSLTIDTKTGSVAPGAITHFGIVDGNFDATTVTTQIFSVGFTAGNKADVIFDCGTGTLSVNGVITTPTSGYVPLGHINFPAGTDVSLNASDTGTNTVTITTTTGAIVTIKPAANGDIIIPAGGLEIVKMEYFTKSANAQNLGSNNNVDIYNTTNVGALANYTAVGGAFTIDATMAISVAGDIRVSTTNFLNNSNSSALGVGAGKTWQVWSSNPDPFTNDVRGGLDYNFKQYNATYGTTTVLGAGNGFLYTLAPQISFSLINNLSKVYDASNNATGLTGHYLASGAVDGDTIGEDGGNPLPNTGLYFSHNVGSGINITATGINVASIVAYNTSLAKPVYGYGLLSTTASGTIGIITKANISAITGIIANNKVYDGNNTATLNVSGAGFTGGYAGDDLLVATSSGTFNNENVGTAKPVAITGLTLGGTDAGNYTLLSSTASTTANITKLALTSITGITALDRVYNAGTGATLNYATPAFGNIVSGDNLTITSAVGTFANKDANPNPKTVTISSIVLGGTDAGNYSLPTIAPTTTAKISKADIAAITGITANNKTYDSLTTATLNTGSASFTNKLAGDTLTVLSSVGNFVDKNVGTGKIVNITGLTLGGTDAGNYNLLITTASASANITKANISAITGITADNKVYSSTPTATLNVGLAGFTGRFAGDVLEVATSSGVFAEEHVGLAKTVNITGLTLGGTDSGNYNLLSTTATAYADITKATITAIEGITANNRKYNAITNATLNTSGVSISFTGAVAGDDLTVATSTGTFINKNVGDGKRVDITNLSLGGTDAENYILSNTTAVTSANITKADISSITGILALNKVYDGNDTAALNLAPAVFNGRFSGDDLTIASPTTGTFRTTGTVIGAHVGTNKIVDITGLTLGGLDAGNYNLVINYATALANISALGINSVSEITGITANNKPYDTLTTATLNISGAVIPGIVLGDDVTVDISSTTANFNDKYVGVGKPVSISGLKLGGDDAVNYVLLNDHASTTANITAIDITEITGITANNKTYDTFTTATLNLGAAVFTGRLGTDNLTVATSTGAFINKSVGDNKRVDITGLTLGGTDAINYNLVKTTAITQANISKANIAAITGIAAQDKVYDSYRTATLDTTGAGFTGILAGDNLTVATSTGNFIDKNVGNGKTVNITGLTLGGTDKDNYNLVITTATSHANITKANITAITNITANNKVYNSESDATLDVSAALFTGIQGSDTLTVATSSGVFTDGPHVGTAKDVFITGLTLGGSNASNYNLLDSTATAKANITEAHISLIAGITAQNKIYDGNDTATLNVSAASFSGKFTGDDLTVATSTGNFNNKDVGTGKLVNVSGLTLGGADAVNYILDDTTAITTANITKLRLNAITGLTANDRVYNAGTNATLNLSSPLFDGIITPGSEDLSIISAVGTFANKKVGINKTVTISSIVLGGLDAGNYDVPLTAPTTTASINKANILNITGVTANSKTFDGNNIASLNVGSASFIGEFAGDDLTVAGATGKFDNPQVGQNKTVNITDLTLGGIDALNYNLIDTTATSVADIIAGSDLIDLLQFVPKSSPVPTFPVFQPMITLFGQSQFSHDGLNFLLPPFSIVSTEIVSTAPAWTFFPIGLASEEPLVKLRSKNGSDYVETDKRDGGYIVRSGEGPTNIVVVGDGVRLELKSSSAK